jgi:phage tail P2-like protein
MSAVFKSLLPPNATGLELALEETMFRATDLEVKLATIWDVDNISSSLLPYLAWSLGVEIWGSDEEFPVEQKRQLIRDYLVIRTLRGTVGAIKRAYGAIGVKAELIENPPSERYPKGEPFKFKLKISGQPITAELRKKVIRLTDLLKPLRTKYFVQIDVELTGSTGLAFMARNTHINRFLAKVEAPL